MDAGGAIAVNLDDLYDYMHRRLVDASTENDAAPLTEVIDLMVEIKGAWDAMPDEVRHATADKVSAGQEAV